MDRAGFAISSVLAFGLTVATAFAQQPTAPPPGAPTAAPADQAPPPVAPADDTSEQTIKAYVHEIVAPVTVTDKQGAIVDGIESGRFHLYDNNKPQDIHVDISVQPISMVIAVQQSDRVDAVLNQIHRIGPMIQPLVTGENGEAAVISFDSRIQEKSGFTNDPDQIDKAIRSVHSGNTPSRLIDAVDHGVQMLKTRPENRRRIILLISETRDVSSEARVREALINAQLANVTVFCVDISRLVTTLASRPEPGPMNQQPPAAYNYPGPTPSTPTSVAQLEPGNNVQFVPLLKEIYLGTKRIFIDNPVEVFTDGTGGEQFTFKKERGLEDAIQSISREIHNQYLITYSPNDLKEDGFHQIRVDVDMPGLTVRTRPGYYLASLSK